MFFTPEQLAVNSRMRGHWDELWAQRNIWNGQNEAMIAANRVHLTPEMLACNAVGGLGRDFWADVDRQIIRLRDEQFGMEIVNDLQSVQTILPVGKTAKLYSVGSSIADDVSVSLDGQAPYSFDHTEYDSDGDPIPVFSAGYGVNWRHAAGLQTVGIDLVLDSQEAKMRVFNQKVVNYFLSGNENIKVGAYPAQGLKNHRNTKKINLGASGENINLTTANAAALIAFFQGAFATVLMQNRVAELDVLWVSPEIGMNLGKVYVENGVTIGTVQQYLLRFIRVKDIRTTFALSGNEFLGYVRRSDIVSPLVGMVTGVTPLPRPLPNSNFNFQILAAAGVQVKKDGEGRGGVIYGANLG